MTDKRLVLTLGALAFVLGGWPAGADHGHRRSLAPYNYRFHQGYRDEYRFETRHHRGAQCQQYSEPRSEKACYWGQRFGHGMAEALGSATGKHNGFLIGYKRSKERGFAEGAGNTIDAAEGRSSVRTNAFIQRLIEENLEAIRRRAAEEGRSRGSADAVARFEALLDSEGSENGKVVDEKIDERALLSTGYSGERRMAATLLPTPSAGEIVRDDLGYQSRIRVYDLDYHSEYGFHEALDSLGVRQEYDVWELEDAAGWAAGSDGWGSTASAAKSWSIFYHSRVREQSPWAELAVDHPQSWYPPEGIPGNPDLRAIFKQAFFDQYQGRMAGYYQENFYQGLDEGSYLGYNVGYNLGRQSTYYAAQAEEFDRVYEERSRQACDEAYAEGTDSGNGYRNGFRATMETYKNNPIVSLEVSGIESLDKVDDGIISPGEPVRLIFSLTNLGLRGTEWKGKIGGPVEGGGEVFAGEIAPGTRQISRSGNLTVAESLEPRDLATLSLELEIAGNGETLTGSYDQIVHHVVELTRMDVAFEVVRGSGTVGVVTRNTSTLESPAEVSLTLTLGGEELQVVSLGALPQGADKTAGFSLEGLDPLQLIGQRKDFRVELLMGGELMETLDGSIGEPDEKRGLVDYFDALHGGPTVGFVPSATDPAARKQKVEDLIIEVARAEIAQFSGRGPENIWKEKGTAECIVGMMARKRLAETQDSLGDTGYRNIGKRLQSLTPTIEGFLKRRAFKKRALEIETDKG